MGDDKDKPAEKNDANKRTRGTTNNTKVKNPCGKCSNECASGNSVPCGGPCGFLYHTACVEGMTPEFVDNCDKMNKIHGGSVFLCTICRKVIGFLNKSLKDQQAEINDLKGHQKDTDAEMKLLHAQIRALTEQLAKLENKADQVTEGIVRVEKEVETGMEKAKQEVRNEVSGEMKEREERDANVIFYGVAEESEPDVETRREKEKKKVEEIVAATGVDVEDALVVKFRLGKWNAEDERPRPLLIRIEDEEKRARLLGNARKLAASQRWKKVYIDRDLTWAQRDEARKHDEKTWKEAESRTKEAEDEGRAVKYISVGPRGKKRVISVPVAPRSRGAGLDEGQT